MILFERDWDRYPNAIADTTTRNKSFLKYAALLKKMNVGNHAWPLTLMQPELQGVDPYSKDLTHEQVVMIIDECRFNPWYFFREIARFPGKAGSDPVMFKANRGNMALFWCFFNHIDFALIMIRQMGKTAASCQLHNYITNIAATGTASQILTKDHTLRKKTVEEIKSYRDIMPEYLQFHTKDDADNTMEITCDALGNQIFTGVGQANEDRADNLGRGLTAPFIHIDEFPYVTNIKTSLPVALASGTAVRDIAKEAGGFYGNVFTTTAGKLNTKDGAYAYSVIKAGMYWNENVMDCIDNDDLYKVVKGNCTSAVPNGPVRVMINGTFSHRQLGKSDEWLRDAIANAGATGEIADRDFFNRWTAGTESPVLPIAISNIINDSEREPRYVQTTARDRYQIRWHIDADKIHDKLTNDSHIVTVDPSEMVGRDGNGMTILDISTMEPIAVSRVVESNILKYAEFLLRMMIQYPKLTLIIENKSSGQSMIDIIGSGLLKAGHNPFKRMFNRVVGQTDGPLKSGWEELQRKDCNMHAMFSKYRNHFGFNTSQASRSLLYDKVLQQAAASTGHVIRDKMLIDEILSLEMKNDRVDHPSGGHDDLCISWLFGHWFVRYGVSLRWYGFDTAKVLSKVSDHGTTRTEEDLLIIQEQRRIRVQYSELEDQLLVARDPGAKFKLMRQLDMLAEISLSDGGEPINMDETLGKLESKESDSVKRRRTLDRLSA